MNLIKLTLTSFLLTTLIACGGGSPDKETETPSLGDEPAAGGGTTGGGDTGGTGGDTGGDTGSSIIVPKLGTGSGVGFFAGKISGDVELINETSTDLSLNAVDTSNINTVINSGDYVAKWASECAAASFNIPQQSLDQASTIETRYDANTCGPTDTVTVSLYKKPDLTTPIDTATVSISIGAAATITEVPALGTIEGSVFKPGELRLNSDYVLVGSRLEISVNSVDTAASNALTQNNYQYKFESSCGASSSFTSNVIASSSGEVTNTYFNHNCTVDNTITVHLFTADADTSDNSLAETTATKIFKAKVPTLGSGSGLDFSAGKINGEANLVEVKITELSINAVDQSDVNNPNKLITTPDYLVEWTSSCAQGSFNVPQQSLSSSTAKTRYDASACAVDHTVTATLFSAKDSSAVIGTPATISIFIESSNANETPVLGTGNGSNFDAGKVSLSSDYVLAGSSVAITVNGVNSADNNSLLNTKYLYKFESTCQSNTVSFSSNVITNNNGTVVNTYFNRTCATDDEITVSLFSANADVNSATPLATAKAQIKTGLPKLGNKSGSGFLAGKFEGNLNLVDEAATVLKATAVDPLNVNTVLNSSDYYVEWTSSCPTAEFSIVTNNLSSAIETRYDGDAQACATDTVTLTLFNKFDEVLDSITGDITISESLVPAEPALGTGVTTGFAVGELQFSETSIAARQTISVSVNIADITGDANTLITDTEYAVVFSSACVTGGESSFDNTQIRTTSGTATTFYTASGCKQTDTINAALYAVEDNAVNTATSLAIAKGDITIALPESNSIEYQDMTARKIAMQNISFSDLPETTTVSFKVKDEFDQPISGKQVAFSLSNKSVGASLSGGTPGNIQGEGEVLASTNAEGIVTITVKSGKTHGLVTVLAVAEKNDGSLLRTQSFGISITTGIPVQTSFSLVLDNFNPRGWNYFGETVNATVFLADRFHNPVPDGTIVNFLADGGSIQPTCETSNGTCSVEWRAQNPRPGFSKDNSPTAKQQTKLATEHPTNDPSSQLFNTGPGVDVNPAWNGGRSGLVTILAYLDGEVDYADANGNGRFDDGEDYSPMAEAYLDANEDGAYTAPDQNNPFEQLIEYVANGTRDPAPATYQGSTCTEAARGNGHCASLVHIRREAQLVMASDNVGFKIDSIVGGKTADLSSATCINVFNEEFVTFNFLVHDYNGNTPINGTALTLEAEGFEVEAVPTAIGNSALTEPVLVPVTIRRDDTFEDLKGFVRLSAAHPVEGIAGSVKSVPVTDDPRIKIKTTDYVIDISSGTQTQDVTFTFEDACGNPPGANDIFIFEVTNMSQTSNAGTANRFQINGSDLTASGDYSLTLSNPVTGDGDGEIIIRAINVAAGGLETTRTEAVTVE